MILVELPETGDSAEAETPEAALLAALTIGEEARLDARRWGYDPAVRLSVDGDGVAVSTLSALSNHRPAPRATTPEEETMTKIGSLDDRAAKRAKTDEEKKAAARERARLSRERRKAEKTEAAVEETPAPIEPVVELPASDAPAADGAELAPALRARIAEAVQGSELVAAPSGAEHRVRVDGKTIAYVTPQKRSVRVHLTSVDGKPVVKVSSVDEFDAAIAAIDEAARAV